MKLKAILLDEATMKRSLMRISHEILEKNKSLDNTVIIGIKTRGVPIAKIIRDNIFSIEKKSLPFGSLDITLCRDDISENEHIPVVSGSSIDFDITGKNVILTDDVIYTGRTARAALDALMRMGRPKSIQLAVMIDRGHRELPIRPDYVCKNVPTSHFEAVKVFLEEQDGRNSVELYDKD